MSNLTNVYEASIKKAIEDWGRNINIVYGDTAECNSCGYDPINKESTNVACSTCGGKYYYQTESNWKIKGVVKTFVGNMKFLDYSLNKYGYIPDSDARLTLWLDDVLLNLSSSTGKTYIDKAVRIEVDGKKFAVKDTSRTGAGDLTVMIVTLKEQK